MEGRIGQLECRYRLIVDGTTSSTDSLDRIVRGSLAEACGLQLDRMMGRDQAVWVVRRVSVDLLVNLQADWDDSVVANKWAALIARAAVRQAAKGADGANVVRFEDQADFVSQFLADLLRGQAWQRWYYCSFQRFRGPATGPVALAVLLENREHTGQILARLAEAGFLEQLLNVLGPEALEELWQTEWKNDAAAGEEEALRPVFLAAVSLAQRSSARGWVANESLRRWLSEYARTAVMPPDWRDRSGLALAVISALEFLWTRGYLPGTMTEIAQAWRAAEKPAAAAFDWLDTGLIEQALTRMSRMEQQTNAYLPDEHRAAGRLTDDTELHAQVTATRSIFLAAMSLLETSGLKEKLVPDRARQGWIEYAKSVVAQPDWTDRTQLVTAVIGALEFLFQRGYVTVTVAEIAQAWREQGKEVPAAFDWLDRDLLEKALSQWAPAAMVADEAESAGESILRPDRSTPRRRRLMADLAKAIALELPVLAKQRLDGKGGAMRVYARLIASDAGWSGDPLATRAIDGLLGAAFWLTGKRMAWLDQIWLDETTVSDTGMGGSGIAATASESASGPTATPGIHGHWKENVQNETAREAEAVTPSNESTRVREQRIPGPRPEMAHGPANASAQAKRAVARELRAAARQRGWGALRSSAFLSQALARLSKEDAAEVLRVCMLEALRSESAAAIVPAEAASYLLPPPAPDSVEQAREAMHPGDSAESITMHVLRAAEHEQTGSRVAVQFLRTFGSAGLDIALAVAAGAAAAASDRRAQLSNGVETRCAGVFLMIRTLVDARLGSTAESAGYPLTPCILALGLCWGGEDSVMEGSLDPGIGLLAGLEADMTLDELQSIWREVDPESHIRFQTVLMDFLAARGIVQGSLAAIHRFPLSGGRYAVALGNGVVWPLVRVVTNDAEEEAAVAAMATAWREATQEESELKPASEESMLALEQALEAIRAGHLDLLMADLTIALAAISFLRLWAAWLRQFSSSSIPYLLRNFIRRPGRVIKTSDGLVIVMDPRPLDIVISMAGYLAPFQARPRPWECSLIFRTQES